MSWIARTDIARQTTLTTLRQKKRTNHHFC